MNDTKVLINIDILGNNVKKITTKYKDYKYFIGVLKSSAYGHGEYIVNELVQNGINYIAVSIIEEAINIRKYNKDISILLLEPISLSNIDIAVKNNLTLTICDLDYLKELLPLKKKLKLHIKVDSGMNRLGFKDKNEIKEAYDLIESDDNYTLEGIYTHFATIGMFDNHYDNQVKSFTELTSLIDLNNIPIVHLGNSVIMISHEKLSFATGIRMGIVLYGYNVSPESNSSGLKNKLRNIRNNYYQNKYNLSKLLYNVELDITPSISMVTSILQIKDVKKGEVIGYGAKYTALEDIKVAILPVGYNNGIGKKNIDRYVIINNTKYYVVGEISMNMMIIKIDNNVKITDEVYIVGNGITVSRLASFNNISLPEQLISIGKNNKRVYIKNNNIEYIDEIR